jgi:hypothetical protein
MSCRCTAAFVAIVLTTACASAYRTQVPNWQRYQDGELAGFLHAPDEDVVNEVPEAAVQRVRGRFFSPATEWVQSTRDPGAIDTRMFVVELRGPGSSQRVRTVATRSGVFDFGPLPNGTYTLKATVSTLGMVVGWSSKVRAIVVSDAADASAEVTVW